MSVNRRTLVETTLLGGALIAGGAAVRAFAQTTPLRRDVATILNRGLDDLAKYDEAVRILKSRTTPSGNAWLTNAEEHRAYCANAVDGPQSEIHGTWWFLPWHRAYLASTEMSLRAALGDASFALPYWHWPLTPRVAAPFKQGALAHTRFGTGDIPPYLLDLSGLSPSTYRGARDPATGEILDVGFGGWGARPDREMRSSIEGVPHGGVHGAVGGLEPLPNGQRRPGDMGALARAARDPIFFAHHANIDRLWEQWRGPATSAHATSEPWADPAFEREFLFFSPDGPRAIKVSTTRRTQDLGYRYELPGEDPSAPDVIVAPGGPPAEPPASALAGPLARSGPINVPPAAPDAVAPVGGRRAFLRLRGVVVPPGGLFVAVYLQKPRTAGFNRAAAQYVGILGVVSASDRDTTGDYALEATKALEALGSGPVEVFFAPLKDAGDPRPVRVRGFELNVVG